MKNENSEIFDRKQPIYDHFRASVHVHDSVISNYTLSLRIMSRKLISSLSFTALVALESNPPKLIKHRQEKLENVLIRVPNYQAPSLDQITQVFNIIDAENLKGNAVVICDKTADGASAVVAACYLIRKYRYLYADGVADARKMLAVGENAMPRPFYLGKVAEYFMQRAQEGWSGHWFPNDRVNGFNAQVIKGDKSGDYWYEPAVHDVSTLPYLK